MWGGGGFCAPVHRGQKHFLGSAGAQAGCSPLFTVGVGWSGVRATRKCVGRVGFGTKPSDIHFEICVQLRGPVERKFLVPLWHFFFRGVPPEGEGGTKNFLCKIFFRAQKTEIF